MREWSDPVGKHIAVAVPTRMYWRTWDDPAMPAATVVSLDWAATLSIMRSEARKAYHEPIRWEFSPRLASMVNLKEFSGLPVVVSEGSFCRLICKDRTYELDLNA